MSKSNYVTSQVLSQLYNLDKIQLTWLDLHEIYLTDPVKFGFMLEELNVVNSSKSYNNIQRAKRKALRIFNSLKNKTLKRLQDEYNLTGSQRLKESYL